MFGNRRLAGVGKPKLAQAGAPFTRRQIVCCGERQKAVQQCLFDFVASQLCRQRAADNATSAAEHVDWHTLNLDIAEQAFFRRTALPRQSVTLP